MRQLILPLALLTASSPALGNSFDKPWHGDFNTNAPQPVDHRVLVGVLARQVVPKEMQKAIKTVTEPIPGVMIIPGDGKIELRFKTTF